MTISREGELLEQLEDRKNSEPIRLLIELLQIRREKYRDKLEKDDFPIARGKAQECKDLLHIFID